MDKWIEKLREKNKRAIAKCISCLENNVNAQEAMLNQLRSFTGHAHVVGFTGSPGTGKSTLINQLIRHLREQSLTVGVLAVDPSSPFTGGAILGDRVRMTEHALDPGVFIRSMGSRGHSGGLSKGTQDAVRVLDAAGFDVILVETVGVGQAELDIMKLVETVVLVLNPGSGDVIQVFKAGIMEIADLYVINKADAPGARRLEADIREYVELSYHDREETPPAIIQTVGTESKGIDRLWIELVQCRNNT